MKNIGKWIFFSVLTICLTALMIIGYGDDVVMLALVTCTLGWIPLGVYLTLR